MYQTVIENTDGRLAADSLGRRYFIAGSAPVVPGRKVWTDGKIIYGNIASGGSGFIYTDSILVYVDHKMNLYRLNGTEVIHCGTAAMIIFLSPMKSARQQESLNRVLP